ncbi:uncharacterized protein PpBr36_09403 [Pyricularia pennisetigena]|nr:uncharacterized protein PpBr36_09403 [Pyricularia pennisetigena]TLS22067.1 hypothetical protein PpBr36_09403 [Pyricularia pennisetigena]
MLSRQLLVGLLVALGISAIPTKDSGSFSNLRPRQD